MTSVPNEIVVSAPGKVILHGEHAVVYGKLGVASSLDLRCRLTLTRNNDTVTLKLPDINIGECWSLSAVKQLYSRLGIENNRRNNQSNFVARKLQPKDASIIKEFLCINSDSESQRTHALLSFFHLYSSLLPTVEGFTICVRSQIPTGAGLGSSASYGACLTGALLVLSETVKPAHLTATAKPEVRLNALKLASEWTYTSEVIMHGKPSGIDNTCCTFGGVISFKDGNTYPEGTCGLQIMLVNTKVPRSTLALVTAVRQRRDKYPSIVDPILDAIDVLAQQALTIIQQLEQLSDANDSSKLISKSTISSSEAIDPAAASADLVAELGELIDMNHKLLGALGVSHPTLEKVVEISAEHGLHAKLTGAGGGGFAMVLLPRRKKEDTFNQCKDCLESLGCEVWTVDLGVPGLCFHSTS